MTDAPQTRESTPRNNLWRGFLRELFGSFLPAVLIVGAINLFVAQPRTVDGESMEPNLYEDQRLIVELVSYHFEQPARGDIIVLNLPGHEDGPLIKRVIGLPGEVVEIRDGRVLIDDEPLHEPYLDERTPGTMQPRLVPEEHLFVLGDNRDSSNDSRYFGMVPYAQVVGRAWVRYWPPSEVGVLP